VKAPSSLARRGEEDDLEQEVAQLLAKPGAVPGVQRLHHLVALLQEVVAQGGVGLLAIPGAAARVAQAIHDFQEVGECFVSGRHPDMLP
jgi:hypothetical protein